MADPAPPPSREDLLNLYGKALDEYRFEVKLNWDRTQYFLALNLGIIAAATGLFKLGLPEPGRYLVAALFLAGFLMSLLAIQAIRRGHNYYRATVHHKTAIEAALRLLEAVEVSPGRRAWLAIGTTGGMRRGLVLLRERESWNADAPLTRGSITLTVVRVLAILAVIDVAGAVAVFF